MYFKQFPKIGYSFDLSERGKITAVTNIFTRFKIKESVLNNAYSLYKYQYEENDTPEIVSYKEYGDPQYHWIISAVNQILDPLFQFPLQKNSLEQKIVKQYGYSSISEAYSAIHHYEYEVKSTLVEVNGPTTVTTNTNIVSLNTYNQVTGTLSSIQLNTPITESVVFRANNADPATSIVATLTKVSTYKPVYVYDYENNLNESNRQIKLLKRDYIQPLLLEFESTLND
jgi:hypothetical protein